MKELKVRREDITETEGTIKVKCFAVNGALFEMIRHDSIDSHITHEDCKHCGTEFKKPFTYSTVCPQCLGKEINEKYLALNLVEWDGESMLYDQSSDKYFSDLEEITEWCEEEEIKLDSLQLLVCTKSSFTHIDWEHITNDFQEVYEDWQAPKEMEDKIAEFNKWLDSQSTGTWFPSNKRVNPFADMHQCEQCFAVVEDINEIQIREEDGNRQVVCGSCDRLLDGHPYP